MAKEDTQFKKGERKFISTEFVKGFSPWNKGKKGVQVSTRKGMKLQPLTEEHKRKIGEAVAGKKHGMWKGGKPKCLDCGKILSNYNNKKCNSCSGLSGEQSHSWKGGVSKIDKLCRRMKEYAQWRSDVFERDNWTCQTCGFRGGYVTAHHLYGFSKILKEENIKNILEARKCGRLWDIINGVTLCEDCHSLTDNYKGRANK